MHFEVRVRNHGSLWEMRPGVFGPYHFFDSRDEALDEAHRTARAAWEHRRIPASVRVLRPDGTWVIDADYGEEAESIG